MPIIRLMVKQEKSHGLHWRLCYESSQGGYSGCRTGHTLSAEYALDSPEFGKEFARYLEELYRSREGYIMASLEAAAAGDN